jgi:hypothetical protein
MIGPSIRLEGGLFVPDLLERAARGHSDHQAATDYHIPKGTQLHDVQLIRDSSPCSVVSVFMS